MLNFPEITQTTHVQVNRVPARTYGLVLVMLGLLLFLSGCTTQNPMRTSMSGSNSTSTAKQSQPSPVQQSKHVYINLGIVINQPGMQKDWPAFSPSNLVVPANSMVTVTLRDYDLGDTPMPGNLPFTTVQGTLDGTASSDGTSFASLGFDKIAHTFSIPELQLNVPLPGDAANGASYNRIASPRT